MADKRTEDIQGIDEAIKAAMLEDNGSRPPDNVIESSEAGGLDAELLESESPADEQKLIGQLEDSLRKLAPSAFGDGKAPA